jgi:hypothetical protein
MYLSMSALRESLTHIEQFQEAEIAEVGTRHAASKGCPEGAVTSPLPERIACYFLIP